MGRVRLRDKGEECGLLGCRKTGEFQVSPSFQRESQNLSVDLELVRLWASDCRREEKRALKAVRQELQIRN